MQSCNIMHTARPSPVSAHSILKKSPREKEKAWKGRTGRGRTPSLSRCGRIVRVTTQSERTHWSKATTHAERAISQSFVGKIRAKDMIRSQIETWSEVSAKSGRAEGALYGEGMKSVLRARANSEGGQNEIEIVLSFSAGFVPKERRKSLISWRFSLVARNPARFESKIHFRKGSTQFFLSFRADEDFA